MLDISAIAPSLVKAADGIWYSSEEEAVSYPEDGNEKCFAVEEQSFWFNHRNACILEVVSGFPPVDKGPIFDIGGGNGFVSLALMRAGWDVVLVEPGRSGAAHARRRNIASVICATTQSAHFRNESLPAVGLFDVVEHIEDDRGFLLSINELLMPEGCLYLTVPAYQFLWSKEDDAAGHFRRYTLQAISDVVRAAGFDVVFTSYFFKPLVLPIFLFRTLPAKLGLALPSKKHDNASKEHAVSNTLLSRILNDMLAAEIMSLRNKKSMRFGGSCLLVARKGLSRTSV